MRHKLSLCKHYGIYNRELCKLINLVHNIRLKNTILFSKICTHIVYSLRFIINLWLLIIDDLFLFINRNFIIKFLIHFFNLLCQVKFPVKFYRFYYFERSKFSIDFENLLWISHRYFLIYFPNFNQCYNLKLPFEFH